MTDTPTWAEDAYRAYLARKESRQEYLKKRADNYKLLYASVQSESLRRSIQRRLVKVLAELSSAKLLAELRTDHARFCRYQERAGQPRQRRSTRRRIAGGADDDPPGEPKPGLGPAQHRARQDAPICDACFLRMWWHGTVEGWGCPVPGGASSCRSSMYRPKQDRRETWPLDQRYPELAYGQVD
jgi:hypothetical protein